MGALHEGHIALVNEARVNCDLVICSIFINPLQFNDLQDLENYPRRLEQDREMLEASGCDLLFTPEKEELFADLKERAYDLGGLDDHWEGPLRPGHFQGVVNVVERLFFYVRPDLAYFGEKDRQQLMILQHVARQQLWPEKIIGRPTVREADGAALSSRNSRLDPSDRKKLPVLYEALQMVERRAFDKPVKDIDQDVKELIGSIDGVDLDYFGIADPVTLAPINTVDDRDDAIALIAARIGPIRVIDNITLRRK